MQVVTIQASWASAEPEDGTFSTYYVPGNRFTEGLQQKIDAADAAGLEVGRPGLQYSPGWALGLPGGTQFVDQYGDVFTGAPASGDDVVNGVTDLAVRAAEGGYLSWLGSQITPGSIIGVRQGGGPLGELRYPDPDYNGHTNCWWAWDASSASILPSPTWTPGTGTVAQATAFLNAYNADLDGFGVWMNGQLQADFDTHELVMLPGVGRAPGWGGHRGAAAARHPGRRIQRGLDWADLLPDLPDQADSVAYTTYLDAPTISADDPERGSGRLPGLTGQGHHHPARRGEHGRRVGIHPRPLCATGPGSRILAHGLDGRVAAQPQRRRRSQRTDPGGARFGLPHDYPAHHHDHYPTDHFDHYDHYYHYPTFDFDHDHDPPAGPLRHP